MNAEKLKSRCKEFISEIGIPTTRFCRNVSVSVSAYNTWQRGELKLADSTLERIDAYLKKYNF